MSMFEIEIRWGKRNQMKMRKKRESDDEGVYDEKRKEEIVC